MTLPTEIHQAFADAKTPAELRLLGARYKDDIDKIRQIEKYGEGMYNYIKANLVVALPMKVVV